jgi:tetratricopeptide (TPR) repeat protein
LVSRATELVRSERFEEAAQILIQFVRQNADHAGAHALLGQVAMRLGALMQAETFLRRAIMLGSTDFELRRNLASVLSQQERPSLALPMFESLAAERDEVSLRAVRANLIEKTGDNARARQLYRDLTVDYPDNPQAWVAYGHSLRAAGMVEEAVAAYRSAIAIAVDYGDAWWGLASIRSKVFDGADIIALRDAIAIAVDLRNTPSLHFALARALHERGEYAEAFHHYDTGNRLRAESLRYNAQELSDEIDEVVNHVDTGFVSCLDSQMDGVERPVFIISLPRSGSTLLEQMLGSHPEIEAVGELPYIPAILRSLMEMATRRGRTTVLQAIASLDDRIAQAMGQDYLKRASLHRKTDKRWFLDKLPHNWSNVLFIKRILPYARFIDIRRPAMDCCFSNFTQSFTSAHASSFTLRDMGRSYVDNVRLMDHLDQVAPGLVHHIRYNSLVESPRPTLEASLAYLGLDWDDTVLDFHRSDRVVRTPSSEQVRRPLNRDGMEVWRPYAEWLGPLREVLGPLSEVAV